MLRAQVVVLTDLTYWGFAKLAEMGASSHRVQRLLAPTADDANTVELVAAYTGAAGHIERSQSKCDIEYIDEAGRSIMGSNTICRHLARSSPHAKDLLGADAGTAAMVHTTYFIDSCT